MTKQAYYEPIVNDSGYILMRPNVGKEADIIQAYPPNPYAESATPLFTIGTKLFQGARGWWYLKNAAVALNIAAPLQSAAAIHAEADDDIVVGAASAIGALTATLTSTANLAAAPLSTANGFAEGYLVVNDEAGEGQMYKIKSHEAASGTSNFIVTLSDPLTVALTTSSQVGLIQSPCANVLASKAVMTGIFAGIPLLAVTASYYFWAQMAGPAPIVAHAAIAKGTKVVLGTTAAKADPGADVTTEITIGYPLTPGIADTETMMVFLCGNW